MPDQNPPRILITAGPTHEPIDDVRYLANRSSGRMGIALAEAAARRGCPTTLLLGPTPRLPRDHSNLALIRFRTTADLERRLAESWPDHDVLIMAAAVADYRPARTSSGKLRREGTGLVLELESTPDLLAGLAERTRGDQRVVGFALEPAESLETSARSKLSRKRLAAIVANPLETMDAESVTAEIFLADGRRIRPDADVSKADFGEWLLQWIVELDGLALTAATI